ncbi:arsenic resistance protein [Microbacterium pygmaeum]|uniref:Arsenite efflux pump ArsB, ACR3 family n=1 Tax=Microbacterium pygmaeum TaxID=370764 RepID=A0A1G8AQN7_9MICO|nr:bile acid:sodium symporter [Microbacterium pygmaeum]SDH22600.1 Arsenite efflux pump ArsB, ACR3 family [Microbacterium pygmaeum]
MTGAPRAQLWAERHQIVLYLVAIAVGLIVGALIPAAHELEVAISPAIGVLLYVTFLGVPFTRLADAFRDARFLTTLLLLNFVIVPVIVLALSRLVAGEAALLVGVLLVLLTPCIDYVIVFTGIAGGAHDKLIAAAPLLMIAQLLLLPVYLTVLAGPGVLEGMEIAPFLEAFVFLIVIPLLLAALTQWVAPRVRWVAAVELGAVGVMVPLMMITLFVVVASQAGLVLANLPGLATVIPIYVVFLIVMAFVGAGTSRIARLDVKSARAVTFSGATRNSLVVLPLALALPAELALVPAVVVAQTLVELIGMTIYVRVIPRLIPARRG